MLAQNFTAFTNTPSMQKMVFAIVSFHFLFFLVLFAAAAREAYQLLKTSAMKLKMPVKSDPIPSMPKTLRKARKIFIL